MADGAVTRRGTCPDCDAPIADRSARWCGACGAPLTATPTSPTSDPTSRPGPRRRLLVTGGAALTLIAGLVVGVGWLVGDGGGATGVQDASIDAPDRSTRDDLLARPASPTRSTPAPAPSPVCAEGPALGCFRWAVEAAQLGVWRQVVAGDGVVAFQEENGDLTALSLDDGAVVWQATGSTTMLGEGYLTVTDGLLLHSDEAGLVGRDLASGQERWRNPDVTSLVARQARTHGELILVSGHHLLTDDLRPVGDLVGALDAATGELRWHHRGESASLAHGGTAVLLTDEGRIEAYGPDGQLRFDVAAPTDQPAAFVGALGHALIVGDGQGDERLLRLSDGAPIEVDGRPVLAYPTMSDEEHTLLVGVEPDTDDGPSLEGDLLLVDEDGIAWHAQGVLEPDGCIVDVQLFVDRIEVADCDGADLHLDRTDGSVTRRTQLPEGRAVQHPDDAWTFGPYRARYEVTDDDTVTEITVWDLARDVAFAHFPDTTMPVTKDGPGRTHYDLGGVAVLLSTGWLTAIDLPDEDDAGGADTGGGQG